MHASGSLAGWLGRAHSACVEHMQCIRKMAYNQSKNVNVGLCANAAYNDTKNERIRKSKNYYHMQIR